MTKDVTKLLEEKNMHLWFRGSPLALCSVKLVLDITEGAMFATAKFMNVQPESIKKVVMDIVCYDSVRQKIDTVCNCIYDDLDVGRNREFGMEMPFKIRDPRTRNVEFLIRSVTTMGGETWENTDFCHFNRSLEQRSIFNVQGSLNRQFLDNCAKVDLDHTKMIFEPIFDKEYWMCACGVLNWADEMRCFNCGVDREWLRYNMQEELLRTQAYERESNARKVREEARELQEHDREKQAEEFKKRREIIRDEQRRLEGKYRAKRLVTILIVMVIMSAVVFGAVFYGVPYMKYKKAKNLMNIRSYDAAIQKFTELDDYLDSAELVKKCLYNKGMDAYLSENYSVAEDIFLDLKDYSDSKEKYKDTIYKKAEKELRDGELVNAALEYEKIGPEAEQELESLKKRIYNEAISMLGGRLIRKEYRAYDYLSYLGAYRDSEEKAKACLYSIAKYEYEQKNYIGAMNKYNKLKGYKDVDELLQKYQFLNDVISAAGEDNSPSVWNGYDIECSKCGEKVSYVFEFYGNGKYCFSVLCDNEQEPVEMSGEYKIEDGVLYTAVKSNGKQEWKRISTISKIQTGANEVEGKNTRMTMSNPFKKSDTIKMYGNLITDDTISFANSK